MTQNIVKFGGLNNQHDPKKVGLTGLVVSVNVDQRDDESARRRQGYTATALTGVALHSLWAPMDGAYGYVADGTTLYHLDSTLNQTPILTLPAATKVSYVDIAGTCVAAINSGGVRFVSGSAEVTFALPAVLDGETSFAAFPSTWAGTCGAYLDGRLYIGTAEGVRFSRAYNVGVYDTRDYLIPVGFQPTNLFAVSDGLWVCGATQAVFLRGSGPSDFTYSEAVNVAVYSGTMCALSDWGLQGAGYLYAACTSDGTYLLLPGGQYVVVGKGVYNPPVGYGHTSIFRKQNGYKQFLTCLTYASEGDKFTNKSITIDHFEV